MKKKAVNVNISELKEILERYMSSKEKLNYAIKIVGHPGVGKSAIVKEVAQKFNKHFIDTRLAFKENIDLGGYPVPDHENKQMIYYRPKFIPPENTPDEYDGSVWFLDESNRAHPTVIQTLFQIITEKYCGEHKLPDNTAIILAGNLGEADNTTITEFDDSALDGRLSIFHLKPSVDDWSDWAKSNGIHSSIINYITLFPERLWNEMEVNPNPRGWHQVSMVIKNNYGLNDEEALIQFLKSNQSSSLKKMIISLICKKTGIDFIEQLIAPREITTEDILNLSKSKYEKIQKSEVSIEDFLWAMTGSINYFVEKKEIVETQLNSNEIQKLANLLTFIAISRKDSGISFLYKLIKEAGIFTQIKEAIPFIEAEENREEILKRINLLLSN